MKQNHTNNNNNNSSNNNVNVNHHHQLQIQHHDDNEKDKTSFLTNPASSLSCSSSASATDNNRNYDGTHNNNNLEEKDKKTPSAAGDVEEEQGDGPGLLDSSGESGTNSIGGGGMIRLPDNLECLIRADHFPTQRHRWNTNEEIAAILISFSRHPEWLSKEVKIRPKSGSVLLYSRKKVRYRRDGYCWKKRKDGKTTREDHMKLKVQGTECIYGCYVHSAILPTFHRRCYWLLQNPDIVLVHYLNVPYPDDNKLIITSNVALWGDKKEWTKEELISQLKPMFFSEEQPDMNNKIQISTAETVEAIVLQLMEKQRIARQSILLESNQSNNNNNNNVINCINTQQQQQLQQQETITTSTTILAPRLSSSNSSASSLSPSSSTSSAATAPIIDIPPIQIPSSATTNNTTIAKQQHHQQQQIQIPVNSNNNRTDQQQQQSRPFVLNLSQFQSAGGLIILNGKQATITQQRTTQQQQHCQQPPIPELTRPQQQQLPQQSQQQQPIFVHPPRPAPLQRVSSAPSPLNYSQSPTTVTANLTQHQHQPHSQQQQPYFEETLEMSHEDIQQTLSANMSDTSAVGLEPMSPSTDDVFINLDAFDILADLSSDDLEHEKTTIVDINPEWAYSDGGTKILVVGQFNHADWDYIVHFGDFPVPAVFVQNGVLKCFCPPHSPGLVPIRVYSNGKQISSNSMVFEYKNEMKANVVVPVVPTETSLKLCLIHRMETVETCFNSFKSDLFGVKSLEDSVVKLCCQMMTLQWNKNSQAIPHPDRGLTLLHLSAALGFTRLLFTLIQWKRENPAEILEQEVNPHSIDHFGLIPLMWSARNGHLECGIILAQWSPESLNQRDSNGRSAIQIAISKGHSKLATELEKIQHTSNRGIMDSNHNFGPFERFQRTLSSSVSEDFGLKDCFFGQPDASLALALPSEEESRVLTLAEQIIAAMPERIKKESCEEMSPGESVDSASMMSSDQSDLSYEFSDRNYRYYDSGTPSSLSPSSSCLQSPCSSSFNVDSPQPTTADFTEFLQASAFEKDFSNLTLSDREQRELYEAAKVIQKAYRSYKGRKKQEEEEKEKVAAVIIQNYYRRYKQYAYLRQVTDAALVIQNQYRSYCENKRFKKCKSGESLAFRQPATNSQGIMRSLSQRKQNQAAKKIQQFMRQSKNQLQRERAERENGVCRL